MEKTIGGETGALVKLESVKHVTAVTSEILKIGILDNHAAEVEALEAIEVLRNLFDPGSDVSAPILGYQVEHCGSGLALELERLEVREAAAEASRGGGVAERDGDVLAGERVELVPASTHLGNGVAVLGVVDVRDDTVEDQVDHTCLPHVPILRHNIEAKSEGKDKGGRGFGSSGERGMGYDDDECVSEEMVGPTCSEIITYIYLRDVM